MATKFLAMDARGRIGARMPRRPSVGGGVDIEFESAVAIIRRELARVQQENRYLAQALRQQNGTIRRIQEQLDSLRQELHDQSSLRLARSAAELYNFGISAATDSQGDSQQQPAADGGGIVLPARSSQSLLDSQR